jgi:hypothetical protein
MERSPVKREPTPFLTSAGIEASIRADDAGGAYPFEFSGGPQVLVDESDAEAASQLLAERTDAA